MTCSLKNPPFLETNGKTWPGETMSFFVDCGLIATLIVFALSNAEMPVEIPFGLNGNCKCCLHS